MPPRCARTAGYAGRDQVNPQASRDAAAALWRDAGITSPIDEIDAAEVYVPFSWYEPMWLESLGFAPEGEGWKLTEAGETEIGGRIPFKRLRRCVLSSNPIGASGMIGSPSPRSRSWARPAITRSPVHARRWATHTAAVHSTSRCGWSPSTSRPERCFSDTTDGRRSNAARDPAHRTDRVRW
jgi:hypothetical protein